jgi:hypothetical protein
MINRETNLGHMINPTYCTRQIGLPTKGPQHHHLQDSGKYKGIRREVISIKEKAWVIERRERRTSPRGEVHPTKYISAPLHGLKSWAMEDQRALDFPPLGGFLDISLENTSGPMLHIHQ